ncbi:MAG: YceI family protein [Nocardiopsaceae bacterium]|jgi:polyisoprenoid-binding protein YceI|nr:YceI family protein [Nocardiopsaceae bacterium]
MITKADAATTPAEAPAAPAGWMAGTWTIDPAHTMVSFAVRHLMSWVRGTFSDVTGQIVTTQELAGSTATAVIGVSSVSTGTQLRDDHLRSPDFFDAGHYPQLSFASTAPRPRNGSWMLAGELTIRDVTRPVELAVEFLGTDPDGLQGEPRIGFSARGSIRRADFGISFGLAADGSKIVIGDKVDIVLDVQAFASA